jgi:oligoribonuclease NrnB/cAMP/cGMP phosphodiesterase (DHH superfamily)
VKKVVLLDHHKTAFELVAKWKEESTLPANFESHLEMEKSGATIAWAYFNKEKELATTKKERKRFAKIYSYIEDNDLFRRSLPDSRAFSVGLGNRNVEYDITKNPSLFLQLQTFETEDLINAGKIQVFSVQAAIDSELEKSFEIHLGGEGSGFGRCLAVFTERSQLRSEMGHQLAEKSISAGLRGIGAVCYYQDGLEEGLYKVSLRSVAEEDTTVISKHFGGGGHRNASSFNISKTVWRQWVVPPSTDQ